MNTQLDQNDISNRSGIDLLLEAMIILKAPASVLEPASLKKVNF